MLQTDYRPANINFDVVSNSNFPENFGQFETEMEMRSFMENLVGINSKISAMRFMDLVEKTELRKDYQALLEDLLPAHETELKRATAVFEEAKEKLADAKEAVRYATNMAISLANEVKRGVREVNLDDKYTFRVPYNDRYYFVTWIN